MVTEQPHGRRHRDRAQRRTAAQACPPGLAAWAGVMVGLVGGAAQLLKAIIGYSGVSLQEGLFLSGQAALGLATLAAVLVWRRDLCRAGGLLAAIGLLAVLLDAGGGGAPPRVLPGVAILAGGLLARFAVGGYPVGRPRQRHLVSSSVAGRLAAAVGWLAVGAQLALILPFLAVGLGAPAWAVVVLYALWGAMLAVALRMRRAHPFSTLLVPPVTFGLMYWLLIAGGRVFDWMA